jgi:hypothetical protein
VVVRPWKLPSIVMMVAWPAGTPLTSYPHLRLTLIAVSTASAPEFIGRIMSLPVRRVSASAKPLSLSLKNARLVSVSLPSCSRATATRRSLVWPKLSAL